MTWIVGAPSPYGYAMGFSDIRVSFSNGLEKDCLQKIYPVGRSIVAGFAGSIRIGFEMLATLAKLLYVDDETIGWDPSEIAKWWPHYARRIFQASPTEQALRCELVMLGVHPNEGNPWPKSYVYKFVSPNFEAVDGNRALQASSIGKGASIRTYCDDLNALWEDDALVNLETLGPGGISSGVMDLLTDRLLGLPIPGISPHLHRILVFRDRYLIRNERSNTHRKSDARVRHATSCDELRRVQEPVSRGSSSG